ncbi:unnamed protein product [Sympodiomycopsis kandeliae]
MSSAELAPHPSSMILEEGADEAAMVTTLPDGRPLVDNTGRAIRRKRPQSCDFCRSRKTKCVRPELEGLEQADRRCVQCRTAGVSCTWDYVPKRPGPQTHLTGGQKRPKLEKVKSGSSEKLKPIPKVTEPAIAPFASLSPSTQPSSKSSVSHHIHHSNGTNTAVSGLSPDSNGFMEAAQLSAHFENPPPNPYQPSNYGLHHPPPPPPHQMHPAGPSAQHQPHLPMFPDSNPNLPPISWPPRQPSSHHQVNFDLPDIGPYGSGRTSPMDTSRQGDRHGSPFSNLYGGVSRQQNDQSLAPIRSPMSDGSSKPRARHLGKIFAAPIERPRSLDDVAPRATFLSIISLYFHHLYPLMPIVHQPSFSHDLISRRDERDGDFLSFVMSLTAYTLIQCPRSVIPSPWPFYRKLHQICHLTSRRMQLERYSSGEAPNLTHCATLYTTHIYLGSTGRTFAANAIHGELVRTAFSCNLHDESKPLPTASGMSGDAQQQPPHLTEIDRQLRRRVYYLIYGSDKTISILSDEPISLRDADTVGVDIPVAVDDDQIFPHKIGKQPSERGPSILTGFETVSKLHRVMSDLVENLRSDRLRPPPDIETTRQKLRYASSILARVQEIVADMPEVLRKPSFDHTEPPPRPAGDLPDLGQPFYQNLALPPLQQRSEQETKSVTQNQSLPFTQWPIGTFDENGLPAQLEIGSQPSSSAAASPSAWGGPPIAGHSSAFTAPFAPTGCNRPATPTVPSTAQLNAAREQVVAFRPSPPAVGSAQAVIPILSGFAICRANILVTEAMLRFVLVDYRELLQSQLKKLRLTLDNTTEMEEEEASNDIEEAARSFFADAVATLPFDALAANGQSLILKLVFIVSSLLNRTSTTSRAYIYMSEFLGTLSKLSERRTAGDEEPGSDEE